MLIRVRTELGIFRAKDLDEAVAQTSHIVGALRREQPTLFQNEQSVALYLDRKCEQEEVTLDKTLVEQGVPHGTMLFAQTTWQCGMCTLINRGKKTQESVCGACGKAPSLETAAEDKEETAAIVPAVAKKRDLPGENDGENQDGKKKLRSLVGGRYSWKGPDSGESIDHFLQSTRPSQTSTSECAWIQVHNYVRDSPGYEVPWSSARLSMEETPKYRAALAKVDEVIARTNRVSASDKVACTTEILNTAVERGETAGKWMLFANREAVDDSWEKIARATVAGKLGRNVQRSTCRHTTRKYGSDDRHANQLVHGRLPRVLSFRVIESRSYFPENAATFSALLGCRHAEKPQEESTLPTCH
eukprot:scaffold1931_cov162-Amphora_coffeaeformis.AAC.3